MAGVSAKKLATLGRSVTSSIADSALIAGSPNGHRADSTDLSGGASDQSHRPPRLRQAGRSGEPDAAPGPVTSARRPSSRKPMA